MKMAANIKKHAMVIIMLVIQNVQSIELRLSGFPALDFDTMKAKTISLVERHPPFSIYHKSIAYMYLYS